MGGLLFGAMPDARLRAQAGQGAAQPRWRDPVSRLLDELWKSEFTVESATKKDAEIYVPQCRLELPNSGSGNHGSETGVRLCGCSTSVPSDCDENGGRHDCRNGGMNPTQ
jgi:hypothetical protein